MLNERTNVRHPLWRKKVDGTLLRLGITPVPLWVAGIWRIGEGFSEVAGRKDPTARIACVLRGDRYHADIVPHRNRAQFRLFLHAGLRDRLRDIYLMSRMRDLDAQLAKRAPARLGPSESPTAENAFWEFLDLEFDAAERTLHLTAHYVQTPTFPNLFSRLAGSPPLRGIDDELAGKDDARIHKQAWRPREEFETEIGARNVIYMLADVGNGLFYVGEAADLVSRFRAGHGPIPSWTHYRYDLLPPGFERLRVTLERMLICDVDAILGGWASDLPVRPGGFRLVNTKIDR